MSYSFVRSIDQWKEILGEYVGKPTNGVDIGKRVLGDVLQYYPAVGRHAYDDVDGEQVFNAMMAFAALMIIEERESQ